MPFQEYLDVCSVVVILWWLHILCSTLWLDVASSAGQSGTVATSKYYDDIYFDSDSEDEDKAGK